MKLSIIITIATLSLSAVASPNSQSSQSSRPTPGLAVQDNSISRADLEQVYNRATQKLQQIEAMVNSDQVGPAYHQALELIETIKMKAGINPMAQYRDKIEVKGILSDADLKKPFDHLLNWQQEELARAVDNYKGGFYLPLLNIAKRARVIYVKTFYRAHQGSLLQRDIDKMLTDLIEIHNFSLLVKDQQASDSYMLFDYDIADSDYQYVFDKEVVLTALSIDDLGVDEKAFEEELTTDRIARFNEYIIGVKIRVPKVEQKKSFGPENYKKCFRLRSKSQFKDWATSYCSEAAHRFQFVNNPAFDLCYRDRFRSEFKDWAVSYCVDNIKKFQF